MLPQFYSLNEYLNTTFGEKVYKLALNGGMSCPNRDGLIDTRGCIFCSAGGSGDFAGSGVSGGSGGTYTFTTNKPIGTANSTILMNRANFYISDGSDWYPFGY